MKSFGLHSTDGTCCIAGLGEAGLVLSRTPGTLEASEIFVSNYRFQAVLTPVEQVESNIFYISNRRIFSLW